MWMKNGFQKMGFQTHSVSYKTLVITEPKRKTWEMYSKVCMRMCVWVKSLQYYEYSWKFITNPVWMLDYVELPII
jgi:hypothetical protein